MELLQQLAACNATADSLLDLLISRKMEDSLLTSSPSLSSSLSSTSTNTSMSEDHGVSGVLSGSVNNTTSRKPRVNPKGPIDKFVPGGLSLDGYRQHMYNHQQTTELLGRTVHHITACDSCDSTTDRSPPVQSCHSALSQRCTESPHCTALPQSADSAARQCYTTRYSTTAT